MDVVARVMRKARLNKIERDLWLHFPTHPTTNAATFSGEGSSYLPAS